MLWLAMSLTESTILLVTVFQVFSVTVKADYILNVQVNSYSNPSNFCPSCIRKGQGNRMPGCCDTFEREVCTGGQRCDNQFFFCLRPLRTASTDRRSCSSGRTSLVNMDAQPINFSANTVLGLENPLQLNGPTNAYQGVQLFLEVVDLDFGDTVDDSVGVYAIDIDRSVGSTIMGVYTPQNSAFGEIGLSLTVICAPNFFGSNCESRINDCIGVNCNNGECIDGVRSFECLCTSGFTGELCEVDIHECEGVNCSGNGQCLDGINSFTCDCVSGYTGQFCEVDIDECEGVTCSGNGQCVDVVSAFTCHCNEAHSGRFCEQSVGVNVTIRIAAITGGVLGSLLLLSIVIILILMVLFKKKRMNTQSSRSVDAIEMKSNVLYGMTIKRRDIEMTQSIQGYGIRSSVQQQHTTTSTTDDSYHVNDGTGPHDQVTRKSKHVYEYVDV